MRPDSALLSAEEIADLTGKVKFRAQLRALAKMGVRFSARPDGSPVVARAFVAKMLSGYASAPSAPAPASPPRRPRG